MPFTGLYLVYSSLYLTDLLAKQCVRVYIYGYDKIIMTGHGRSKWIEITNTRHLQIIHF